MIARCGLRTRLPDARSGAGLAGAARPLRRHQGRRDSDAASRGRGAAPHERPASADLARPRGAQRAGQAVACPAAPAAAGVTPNPAALARQPRCPPLDLPATTARPTTYPAADPGVRAADGPRESPLGVQAHPGRAGRSRPHRGRLDRLPPGRDWSGQDEGEERCGRNWGRDSAVHATPARRAPTGSWADTAFLPTRSPTPRARRRPYRASLLRRRPARSSTAPAPNLCTRPQHELRPPARTPCAVRRGRRGPRAGGAAPGHRAGGAR